MIACFGLFLLLRVGRSRTGYHRAFTWSFSGYCVRTGEVNRRNGDRLHLARLHLSLHRRIRASVSGRTFVGKSCGCRYSRRKSVGVAYPKNSSLRRTISSFTATIAACDFLLRFAELLACCAAVSVKSAASRSPTPADARCGSCPPSSAPSPTRTSICCKDWKAFFKNIAFTRKKRTTDLKTTRIYSKVSYPCVSAFSSSYPRWAFIARHSGAPAMRCRRGSHTPPCPRCVHDRRP